MASKYMGAKMLNKQNLKQKLKAQDKAANKTNKLVLNQGEFLDRKKQRFDLSDSILPEGEGDFGPHKEEDMNPRYTLSYKMLSQRKNHFLLTMDDGMIGSDDDSSDGKDNEQLNQIHEMIHRCQSRTNSLY